jgi:nucleotide-binding universal stress UspA family protein
MTGRIVVGIDGSPQSGNALEWAIERARLGGEQLELVNAWSMPPDLDFYGYRGLAARQPVDWLTEFSEEVLDAATKRVAEAGPDLTSTKTSKMGHPVSILVEASRDATALVIGRRGLGAAASALMGSVSNRLAVEAKCPLVVVGEGELPTSGPIVVGVDDSEFGANALRYAIAEAAVRKTSVRAVAAYEAFHQGFRGDPELLARLQADIEAEAADTAARAITDVLGTDSPTVDVERVTVESPPAEAILGNAADAQLIVVGTHGKGLVRRVLLGSVSRQVLNDAEVPVAVVDLPDA